MRNTPTLISSLLLALTASGCATDSGDPALGEDEASIASALETDDGELGMSDEAPAFGLEDVLAEALDAEEDTADSTEDDPEVAGMLNAPDTRIVHAQLAWGQFPYNPDFGEATNWSGRLSVNRGAIVLRQTVAFERRTDGVLPREGRLFADFTSVTGPHHDGLRLTIIDPEPGSDEPLTLSYSRPDRTVFTVEVDQLIAEPQERVVDDLGNQVLAVAISQPVDVCQHGFLRGRWHQVAPNRGVLLGQVRGARGALLGHMRGLWGQRRNGSKVFFGKYIDRDGAFRGLFAGSYDAGAFRGRWLIRSGDVGGLAGRYRETVAGPVVRGLYVGRWAEASCDIPASDDGPASMPSQPEPNPVGESQDGA